jgi:hypothetical protein
MVNGALVDIEILFRHDSERADRGERTAVLAIQLVDTIAINDQLALLAAWQIEVVHQTVARIVVGSVTLVVHAGRPSSRSRSPYSRGSSHRASDIAPSLAWVLAV